MENFENKPKFKFTKREESKANEKSQITKQTTENFNIEELKSYYIDFMSAYSSKYNIKFLTKFLNSK